MSLHKKQILAYKQGVDDVILGLEDALRDVKGVGPELTTRIIDKMREKGSRALSAHIEGNTLSKTSMSDLGGVKKYKR